MKGIGKKGTNSGPGASAGKLLQLVLPLAIALAALLALAATPALAAKTHRLKATITTTGDPTSVAVEEVGGNLFFGEGSPSNCVRITGPEGGAPSGVSSPQICGFPGGSANPSGIAVDNSPTSPSKGALYVSEESGAVKKFALEGGKYVLKGELSATPALGQVFGIAVDPKGNLFVADYGGKAVVEFNPAGTQIARVDLPASVGSPASVALDSAGDLFIGSFTTAVYRFDANGAGEIEAGTVPVQVVEPGHAFGAAVNPATDELFVSIGDEGNRHVAQYAAACPTEGAGAKEHCAPESEFGAGTLTYPARIAVSSKTGFVYVAEPGTFGVIKAVAVFGPTVIVPGSVTGQASALTGVTATLNATVDPSGSQLDECKFQWGPTTAYGNTVPCAETPAQIGSGNGAVPVHADLTGLGFGTAYHFRLVATSPTTVPDEVGPSVGADETFTTLGPQIHAESASRVTDTTARLEGTVNPETQETTYLFQYVSEADFQASQWANALSLPLGGETIGAGSEDVKVAQDLAGLAPATTYRFRLVATNHCKPDPTEECVAFGPGQGFTTYALALSGLPDARAYEQVTPVDKNGAAPAALNDQIQATADGSGFIYLSGGSIPGAEGAQEFPTYLATRGSDWSTQGLLPSASAGSVASVLGWDEDLTQSYALLATTPGAPVSFLQRSSTTHATQEITSFTTDFANSDAHKLFYIGSSNGGSTVIFESPVVLSPGGAANTYNTYAWDRVSGELALVGVFNNGLPPTKGSLAGSNEIVSHVHYNQAQHAVSADGSRAFFTDINSSQLYLRQNPTQPQSALNGGGGCTEVALACTIQVSASQRALADPQGKKPAAFRTATLDGSMVFFTSPGKLTDDATTGPADAGSDLYRYDAESGELIDIAPDAGDPNGAEVLGVLGSSADGSYVYFAANGVLAAGAVPGDCRDITPVSPGEGSCNLYLWHEGTTTFIAPMEMSSGYEGADSANWFPATRGGRETNTSRVTPDGQTLLFRARQSLTTSDSGGRPDFYRYSAGNADLSCVSCNPTGAATVGTPTLHSLIKTGEGGAPVLTRNLSQDGGRAFFESVDRLVADDTNGVKDVYEWEASGAGSCDSEAQNGGCLYLISSGADPEPSYFGDASADGSDAFIYTGQSLVGQDRDRIVDIYDARVGGGIASQNPPPPPVPCGGEGACKGAVPPPPATPSPGSAGFSGPGNPTSTQHKPHKKKKKAHKKKQHKKRHASRKHG